jgi:hypothetical protein
MVRKKNNLGKNLGQKVAEKIIFFPKISKTISSKNLNYTKGTIQP